MGIPSFKQINTNDDPNLMRVQDNVSQFAKSLSANQLLDGVLIENVDITAGSNAIEHKLGRKYRGWIVVRQILIGDPPILAEADIQKDETKFLIIVSNIDTRASFYVF
jgi:hypothetical protein